MTHTSPNRRAVGAVARAPSQNSPRRRESAVTKLTTRQYNAGQGRQKTTFKSNVVRNLKKDIARMMPFLEAKQASGSPNVALREQAKGRRARKEKVEA